MHPRTGTLQTQWNECIEQYANNFIEKWGFANQFHACVINTFKAHAVTEKIAPAKYFQLTSEQHKSISEWDLYEFEEYLKLNGPKLLRHHTLTLFERREPQENIESQSVKTPRPN